MVILLFKQYVSYRCNFCEDVLTTHVGTSEGCKHRYQEIKHSNDDRFDRSHCKTQMQTIMWIQWEFMRTNMNVSDFEAFFSNVSQSNWTVFFLHRSGTCRETPVIIAVILDRRIYNQGQFEIYISRCRREMNADIYINNCYFSGYKNLIFFRIFSRYFTDFKYEMNPWYWPSVSKNE